MTSLRYLFLGALALVFTVLALANREMVTLRLIPEELGLSLGAEIAQPVPLFVVIFAAVAFGLLIGFAWEWLREHKHRAQAARDRAQKERLEKELAKATASKSEEDDVLALLESSR